MRIWRWAPRRIRGDWTLHLDFRGELNDKLVGFYRSTYQGPDGGTEVIATTHFEATDARRAFPSWDEPDLKAVFGITLIVAPDLTALSNGPEIERSTLEDGRVRLVFADTMSMSTYLVAFVVGHLELTDPVDAGGVPTRVAHVPGKGPIAAFALEIGAHSLNWFAEYYGIPYPDAKVDHIALPDFAQGAMENLGCITYREAALLVDPATSTHGEQLDVAETVAHELAHMWFGDLVTMRWWNGLWLNEAFATFMAMLAVDAYRPDWEVWNQFARSRSAALEVDALASTRSIEYPVHSPDDANGMFDTLTYLKGGAILRMLEQYLGPDRFRDGIRRYLREHEHGNTETHDLWDALEEETGEPVRRIMDTWIWQGGYPLISVNDRRRRHAPVLAAPVLAFPPRRRDQVGGAAAGPSDHARWSRDHRRHPGGGGRRHAPDALARRGRRRERRRHQLRARLVRRGPGRPSRRSRDARAQPARALRARGRRVGGGRRRIHERVVVLPVRRGVHGRDRAARVAVDPHRASAGAIASSKASRAIGSATTCGASCARRSTGSGGRRLPTSRTWSARSGNARAGARRARGRPRGEGADARARGRGARRRGCRRPPRIGRGAGRRDERRRRRLRALLADGRTTASRRRSSSGTSTRWHAFRDPELFDSLLASTLTDDVRPQDAPFLLAMATTNRDLGDRAWRFIADNWDEALDRFAASNIISLASGARFLSLPEQQRAVEAFFQTHTIPQAGLMLDQTLERQRIYVALRERAEKDLAQAVLGFVVTHRSRVLSTS